MTIDNKTIKTLSHEEQVELVHSDPDFVKSKKSNNSLKKFVDMHPDGTNDRHIAHLLLITPEKVAEIYNGAVKKIRHLLKVVLD